MYNVQININLFLIIVIPDPIDDIVYFVLYLKYYLYLMNVFSSIMQVI
jgi:hypothetical protein